MNYIDNFWHDVAFALILGACGGYILALIL
jgi:hypothetical protein